MTDRNAHSAAAETIAWGLIVLALALLVVLLFTPSY